MRPALGSTFATWPLADLLSLEAIPLAVPCAPTGPPGPSIAPLSEVVVPDVPAGTPAAMSTAEPLAGLSRTGVPCIVAVGRVSLSELEHATASAAAAIDEPIRTDMVFPP
jgi:hypothetical protein